MSVAFTMGQTLGSGDLNIFVRDCDGNLVDPAEISYCIFDATSGSPILVGNLCQCPAQNGVGQYYADITLESTENIGSYEIHWTFKAEATSNTELVKQRFAIIKIVDPKEFMAETGSIVYQPGQILGEKDLFINVTRANGNITDPHYISYALFDKSTGIEILQSGSEQIPVRISTGSFYANCQIPLNGNTGDWLVRWKIQESEGCEIKEACQPFAVVCPGTQVGSLFSEKEKTCIRRLRVILRDNNPDRNYRFAPPNPEESIQQYTQVFGYVWTDEELFEYLLHAIDWLNTQPPIESYNTETLPSFLKSLVITYAAAVALEALAINYIHEQFEYSISGISLSLSDRYGNYSAMAGSLRGSATEQVTNYKEKGIKIIRGIIQPRFGIGISSALGPFGGSNVLSRRSFISNTSGR